MLKGSKLMSLLHRKPKSAAIEEEGEERQEMRVEHIEVNELKKSVSNVFLASTLMLADPDNCLSRAVRALCPAIPPNKYEHETGFTRNAWLLMASFHIPGG